MFVICSVLAQAKGKTHPHIPNKSANSASTENAGELVWDVLPFYSFPILAFEKMREGF